MSAIGLEIIGATSLAPLCEGVFSIAVPAPPPDRMPALLTGETSIPALGVTEIASPGALVGAVAPGEVAMFWLALKMDFPTEGGPRALSLLRMGAPPALPLRPCASLVCYADRAVIRFGVHGAPLLHPQGEAGARWRESVEQCRARLAKQLAALRGPHLRIDLFAEGISPSQQEELVRALGVGASRGPAPYATPTPIPGACVRCRHANQETSDLRQERILACRFVGARALESRCDLPSEDGEGDAFLFEPYDGANATWGRPDPIFRT